jgi:SAM-dependent methyltransferase
MRDGRPNGRDPLRRAAEIVEVARELRRSAPPPREAPFFLLDAETTYDLRVLDTLSEHGIFRKYEFVLLTDSGLGGEARWLATRFGCRILGLDADLPAVSAATMLNERAHMHGHVRFQVGRPEDLPLRDRLFTHVWRLRLPAVQAQPRVLRETYRVLRPGGRFALHSPCGGEKEPARLLETLAEVGFVDVHWRRRSLAELPQICRIARARLDRQAVEAAGPGEVRGGRTTSSLQLFASRPS